MKKSFTYMGVKMPDLVASKDAKHAAIMRKIHPNYGKGRNLTKQELHPKLKRTHSKHEEFLGNNK